MRTCSADVLQRLHGIAKIPHSRKTLSHPTPFRRDVCESRTPCTTSDSPCAGCTRSRFRGDLESIPHRRREPLWPSNNPAPNATMLLLNSLQACPQRVELSSLLRFVLLQSLFLQLLRGRHGGAAAANTPAGCLGCRACSLLPLLSKSSQVHLWVCCGWSL